MHLLRLKYPEYAHKPDIGIVHKHDIITRIYTRINMTLLLFNIIIGTLGILLSFRGCLDLQLRQMQRNPFSYLQPLSCSVDRV